MELGNIENWKDIRELVLMSVGTDKGRWFAYPEFGSELWILRQTGKVTSQTAGTVRQMILDSIQWIITDGLADTIDCETKQMGKNRINWKVTVKKSGQKPLYIEEMWDAAE